MKERNLKREVLELLNGIRNSKAITLTGVSEVGTPDLLWVYRGQTIFIELKTPDTEPAPIQLARHSEWIRAGAGVSVIHTMQEAHKLVWAVRKLLE